MDIHSLHPFIHSLTLSNSVYIYKPALGNSSSFFACILRLLWPSRQLLSLFCSSFLRLSTLRLLETPFACWTSLPQWRETGCRSTPLEMSYPRIHLRPPTTPPITQPTAPSRAVRKTRRTTSRHHEHAPGGGSAMAAANDTGSQ